MDRKTHVSKIQRPSVSPKRQPWNKGRIVFRKCPFLPKPVWAISAWSERKGNCRNLALFHLAIDSIPRGCDLVRLKVFDLVVRDRVRERVMIVRSQNLRAVRRLLDHAKVDGTVRYLGVALKDAPSIAEMIDSRSPSRTGRTSAAPQATVWSA